MRLVQTLRIIERLGLTIATEEQSKGMADVVCCIAIAVERKVE